MADYWYNGVRLLSYRALLNFCVGGRGIGKSYYWKRFCIRQFLKSGAKFIYARRYQADLDKILPTWYNDIADEFTDHKLVVEHMTLKVDGKIAGYAIPVTAFNKWKSVAFPDVETLFFDEFLTAENDYIGGVAHPEREPELMLSMIQTVARGGGKSFRDNFRAVLVANSISVTNPYFIYFGLTSRLKPNTKYAVNDDVWACEICKDSPVSADVAESKLGRLIQDTAYGNMALNNDFYMDNPAFIQPKPRGQSTYYMSLVINGKTYGVHYYLTHGFFYVDNRVDPTFPRAYAVDEPSADVGRINALSKLSTYQQMCALSNAFRQGNIRFASQQIKDAVAFYIT